MQSYELGHIKLHTAEDENELWICATFPTIHRTINANKSLYTEMGLHVANITQSPKLTHVFPHVHKEPPAST